MATESNIQCKKIRLVSRLVSALALWGTFASAILIALAAVLSFSLLNQSSGSSILQHYFNHIEVDFNALASHQQIVLLASICLMLAMVTAVFYLLYRLFGAFHRSGVFSPAAIKSARTLAWVFSVSFVYMLLMDTLAPLPTDSQALKAYAGNAYFQDAILLGIIWIGVWILEYGHTLLSENEMTI